MQQQPYSSKVFRPTAPPANRPLPPRTRVTLPGRPPIRILDLPRVHDGVMRFGSGSTYMAAQHVLAEHRWTGIAAVAVGTQRTIYTVYLAGYPVCDRASLGKAQRALRRAQRRQAVGHAILGWLERHHWLSPIRVEALRRARATEERA